MLGKELKILSSIIIALVTVTSSFATTPLNDTTEVNAISLWDQKIYSDYDCLNDTTLSFRAYKEGVHGYNILKEQGKLKRDQFLTIVDFSKHSGTERLYVIDVEENRVVFKTLCSHGRNSGGASAYKFSNKSGSSMSSLGFFVTEATYSGKFDLALRINGLEYCNSNARSRGVVIHGAKYATYDFLNRNNGVLGRSLGCPAVPLDEADFLIDLIKEGSCFYIYNENSSYHRHSRILRNYDFLTNNDFLGSL